MGDYYGLPTGSLENSFLRLEYLTTAGPRIVRLTLAGSDQNLLVEIPDVTIPSPAGDYFLRGGHRLWHSPEVMPRSYLPDNSGLEVEQLADGARLVQSTEAQTGITKSLEVRLDAKRAAVSVRHSLRNDGVWPVELAPWGITQLPLGGVAILPQQQGALDPSGLQPNRQLVLWPYASWRDPRLLIDDDYVLLQAAPRVPACKVGYLSRAGWVAYLRQGVLFVKRFDPRPESIHPDFGCNAEFYCDDRFIEMESLAPLTRLEPGQSAEHVETWEIYPGIDAPQTIEGVRSVVKALG